MAEQIAGDPNAPWPEDFTIPDDSDEPTGGATNPGFEALANRTAHLYANRHVLSVVDVLDTAPTDVVVPLWATHCFYAGCAGGGGGGGGAPTPGMDRVNAGGGGGGGAPYRTGIFGVTGGETLIAQAGAGGVGGTGAATMTSDPTVGAVGAPSTITRESDSTVLANLGGGGQGGVSPKTPNILAPYGILAIANVENTATGEVTLRQYAFAAGGAPGPIQATKGAASSFEGALESSAPQTGGRGTSKTIDDTHPSGIGSGRQSGTGTIGGARGTHGANSSSYWGGGAGGGGGAGPFGDGARGGNGGGANNGGAAGNGATGDSALANTGAGGGGGGAAGGSSTGIGAGGNGGAGGSGRITLVFLRGGV